MFPLVSVPYENTLKACLLIYFNHIVLVEDRWSSRPRLVEGGQGEDISDVAAAEGQMELNAQAEGGGGQGED